MIDKEIFAQRMGLLAGRIGRELEAPVFAEYYRVLSAELTTEQFVGASALVFKTWSAEYRNWPSPQQFVELIAPVAAPSLTANEAFERVLEISNDPRIPIPERRERIQALGANSLRAFLAAGGRREFENVLEADVKWIRRSFVEAFQAACDGAEAEQSAALALASASDTVKQLVNATAQSLASPAAKRIAGTPDYSKKGAA